MELSFWEKNNYLQYDCIIVGGGIVGLSTAASLLEKAPRLRVMLVERGIFSQGASTKNAGFACFGSLSEIIRDIKQHGEKPVMATIQKRWQGLKRLENRLGHTALDYHNWGGYELLEASQLNYLEELDRVNAFLHPYFNQEVFQLRNAQISEFGFNPELIKALVFNPLEGQIDPARMLQALRLYGQSRGLLYTSGAEVHAVHPESAGPKVGIRCVALQGQESLFLQARQVVLATNAFSQRFLGEKAPQPGRGLVLATEEIPQLGFQGTFHYDEGYYYFRNYQNRIILGGGRNLDFEGENTETFGINPKIKEDLLYKLQHMIYPKSPLQVEHWWSGIMGFHPQQETPILQAGPGVWAGTGLNGMGVAIGSEIGEELASKVLEQL